MTQQPSPNPSNQPNPFVPASGIEGTGSLGGEQRDPDRADGGGLDRHVEHERPWQGTDQGDPPLIVRVQVRIVTGRSADAVRAAQGNALRALITAMTGRDAEPT